MEAELGFDDHTIEFKSFVNGQTAPGVSAAWHNIQVAQTNPVRARVVGKAVCSVGWGIGGGGGACVVGGEQLNTSIRLWHVMYEPPGSVAHCCPAS